MMVDIGDIVGGKVGKSGRWLYIMAMLYISKYMYASNRFAKCSL